MHTQTINLVEQAVLERIRAKAAFTALDISNALKLDRYPVQHKEVAAIVRDIFQSGAMGHYDYDRSQIEVVTDGGTKRTQAFLYRHVETREREYTRRDQNSLPHVPADIARDLADCVAADPTPLLPRPPRRPRGASRPRANTGRRDGALPIPRSLVQSLGWHEGMTLTLTCENGKMTLVPQSVTTQNSSETTVRVWGGLRLRVCKIKLTQGGLTAEQVTVELDGGKICLGRKGEN